MNGVGREQNEDRPGYEGHMIVGCGFGVSEGDAFIKVHGLGGWLGLSVYQLLRKPRPAVASETEKFISGIGAEPDSAHAKPAPSGWQQANVNGLVDRPAMDGSHAANHLRVDGVGVGGEVHAFKALRSLIATFCWKIVGFPKAK